jgi:uncharacterized protein
MGINAIQIKEEILRALTENRNDIKNYGAKRIGLFGSFVRGEQKESSDIDLLVEFAERKKNYDNFIDLAFFLEALLGRKVDLMTEESLSPYIRPYILKETEYVQIHN